MRTYSHIHTFSSIVLNTVSIKVKIQYFLFSSVKLLEENSDRLHDWTERQRENSEPIRQARSLLWSGVELMWRWLLLLCSCLREVKLDYSWQHHRMCRDSRPHSSHVISLKHSRTDQLICVTALRSTVALKVKTQQHFTKYQTTDRDSGSVQLQPRTWGAFKLNSSWPPATGRSAGDCRGGDTNTAMKLDTLYVTGTERANKSG